MTNQGQKRIEELEASVSRWKSLHGIAVNTAATTERELRTKIRDMEGVVKDASKGVASAEASRDSMAKMLEIAEAELRAALGLLKAARDAWFGEQPTYAREIYEFLQGRIL